MKTAKKDLKEVIFTELQRQTQSTALRDADKECLLQGRNYVLAQATYNLVSLLPWGQDQFSCRDVPQMALTAAKHQRGMAIKADTYEAYLYAAKHVECIAGACFILIPCGQVDRITEEIGCIQRELEKSAHEKKVQN